MTLELFALGVTILIWLISTIVKSLRGLSKQLRGTNARPSLVQQAAAEAERQAAASRPPGPMAPPPPVSVRYKTSAATFVSQDDALRAEEISGLGVPLTFPAAAPRAAQAAPLFGGTDDLVRAIILQEVLGPPLSRRPAAPSPAPPPA